MRLHDIQEVIQEKIAPNFRNWRDFGNFEEPKGAFRKSQAEMCMLATEAVHHLHSVFDPLACAIYWFSVPEAKREKRLLEPNFRKVQTCESLPEKYREVFDQIGSTNSFFHLAALSNLAKHSRIVHPTFSLLTDSVVPSNAEEAVIFEQCTGINWLKRTGEKGEKAPVVKFPRTPIAIFLRDELQRIAPLFSELAKLIRSDLDLLLKAEKQ